MQFVFDGLGNGAGMADQIVANLRLQIVSGNLKDGEKLSENSLATQFGSSRGPVREALKVLEHEGLVSLTRQGAIVRGLTEKELGQLYDGRYMLEGYCLKHLDTAKVPALVDKLEVIVDRMALALKHRDYEEFSRQDIQFHNLPFELLDHRFIRQFWENIQGLYQTVLYIGTKRRFEQGDFDYKQGVVEKHAILISRLRIGDWPDIEISLKEHFSQNSWMHKDEF